MGVSRRKCTDKGQGYGLFKEGLVGGWPWFPQLLRQVWEGDSAGCQPSSAVTVTDQSKAPLVTVAACVQGVTYLQPGQTLARLFLWSLFVLPGPEVSWPQG